MKLTSLLIAGLCFTIMLQAQVSKNLEVTAGGLKTALTTEELNTVTKLTLTGTIDARDFKTMRDNMPLLAEIDLSGVEVVEYTGTEGTTGTDNTLYPASGIPQYAFHNPSGVSKNTLTEIKISNTINSIGIAAFHNCRGLISFYIPESVASIGNWAFARSSGPKIVDTNNLNFSSIDGILFDKDHSKLIHCPVNIEGDYVLPLGVTSIEMTGFYECRGMTSIVIPSSVTTIGAYSFGYCTGLTTLQIPSSVNSMGHRSFLGCSGLTSIYSYKFTPVDLSTVNEVFSNVNKTTCVLNVPYGSKPAYQAANQWQDFQSIVEMPGFKLSSTKVNMEETEGSTTTVSISADVIWTATSDQSWLTIDPATGSGEAQTVTFTATEANSTATPRIATVTVSAEGVESQTITVTQEGSNAPIEVTAGNLINLFTPEQLATITKLTLTGTIDARDFKTMRDKMPLLVEIDLSGTMVVAYQGSEGTSPYEYNNNYPANAVPAFAFWNPETYQGKISLNYLLLPNSVTSLGESALRNCSSLTSIIIPPLVNSIDYATFYLCTGLTSITIPPSVISIGSSAFGVCLGLASINIPYSVSFVGNGAFWSLITVDSANPNFSDSDGVLFDKTQTKLIQCPSSKTGSYLIPSSVTSIGEYAFSFCNGLTAINIPSSVSSIGFASFYYCSGIESISIPSSVNFIESSAFYGCSKLSSIYTYSNVPVDLTSHYDIFGEINKTTCSLYVPYSSKTTYQAANQWQDFENIVEMSGFSLSSTTANLEAAEGSTSTVNISSDVTWTATSDQSWLTVEPATGSGDEQTITFTAIEANTTAIPRIATVTVSADGVESQTISVTQAGFDFLLYEIKFDVLNASGWFGGDNRSNIGPRNIGNGQSVFIESSIILDNFSFYFTRPFDFDQNPEYNGHEVILNLNIRDLDGNIIQNKQVLVPATFNGGWITWSDIKLNVLAKSTLIFTCNLVGAYSTAQYTSGIGADYYAGYEDGFRYDKAGTSDSDMDLWSGWDIHPWDANFWLQGTLEKGFKISASATSIDAAAGSTTQVNIASNVTWTATSDQSWLTIDPATSSGIEKTVTLTATEANTSAIPRVATVTISAEGVEPQTITVTQAGSNAPIEVTAGNLINLFTPEQLATITKLTLTGTIDARDFKTMRDEMPLLAEIDLSEVNIVAYSGSEGTSIWGNNDYLANTIPEFAFLNSNWNGKTSLKLFVSPLSILTIEQFALASCQGLTNLSIPSSVINIGNDVFYNCQNLVTVSIPSSVINIGNESFLGCRNLNSVFVPSSVKVIGSRAFSSGVGMISVELNNSEYSSIDGVLYNKTQSTILQCPKSKNGTFSIPSSVVIIGMYAFEGCKDLTSVSFPLTVTSIQSGAFVDCHGLTTISIPSSITYIGAYAFASCNNLNSIFSYSILPIDLINHQGVFEGINKTTCTLYVPFGSKAVYQSANQWQDFTNIVEMEEFSDIAKDSLALVALYYATDGPKWTNNENWLTGPVDTWYGVTVENNRVIGLNLGDYTASSNNLNGYLPSEIGNLSELRELKLIGNKNLTGNLPDEIGKLTSLQYLNLYGCGFSGTIPLAIGNLTNLNYLDLQSCNFTNTIPDTLKHLTNLKTLWLSNNNFDPDIFPHWITDMNWLTSLNLSVCNIIGNIPPELGQLTGLEYLGLGHNQLSGIIPDEICALSSTQFNLSYNNFDFQSCPTIQCLKDNGARFTDSEQLQLSGFSLINDCAVINTCPQYFHTVWEGTSGTNHMNINILDAKMDGADLEPGDEIGVFDGDLCVGFGKVLKTIDQQNILNIIVSKNDGSGNGFTSGNEVLYKFWDCSAETEIIVNDVQCFNQLNPVTCLPFEALATVFVRLSSISDICQSLQLSAGWNMFSVPSTPEPADIVQVFQPFITNNSLVKIQDEGGKSVEDWGIYGGWQNDIGNISPTEGYKIKLSKNDNLEVCGTPVKYPYAIPLKDGWNIIGFPHTISVDGLSVLKQLMDSKTLVKVQDEGGKSIEDWGIYGGWQNDIGDFVPGKGYALKVNADETLWIYESYPKSSAILPDVAATTHFQPSFTGNGLDHMNINLLGLPVNILQAGDELAVFDGTTCVGAVSLTSYNFNSQSVSIAASARDNQGMPGFSDGNPITLKLWNSKQNKEYSLEPEIVKGSAVFAKHKTTFASLEKYVTTGLGGITEFDLTEINCYPNPFSDDVNIEIKLAKDSEVKVEVLNQLGQRVRILQTEKMMNRGVHRLTWDGKGADNQQASTGIYHLKITVENSVIVRKMVYSK